MNVKETETESTAIISYEGVLYAGHNVLLQIVL